MKKRISPERSIFLFGLFLGFGAGFFLAMAIAITFGGAFPE